MRPPRKIDPRVFAPNFAMQNTPPTEEIPGVESPELFEDAEPLDTGFSNVPEDPTEALPSPRFGAPEPYTSPPIEIKQRPGQNSGATLAGAFYSKYTDSAGDTYLQGGQVMSGSGNFTIADLKVIDHTTGPVEADGDRLVLEVTVNGYVVDGVLLAGLTATAAAYISPAVSTIDPNTMPTLANYTSRKVFIEIGRFTATDFLPANPGNIRIAFCPGAYQITRF